MMNERTINLLYFAAGALTGGAIAFKLVKGKYEQIANDEIDAIRDYYEKREDDIVDYYMNGGNEFEDEELPEKEESIPASSSKLEEKPSITDYSNMVTKEGYTDYSAVKSEKGTANEEKDEKNKEEEDDWNDPVIIEPDEFGDIEDYQQVYLTYYEDGFVVDDRTEEVMMDDLDDTIGYAALDEIGKYEDDIIHVRNDKLEIYYEITKDERNYRDVAGI